MKRTSALRIELVAFVIAMALLPLAGCAKPGNSSGSAPSGGAASAPSVSEAAAPGASPGKTTEKAVTIPRRIIYSADVTLTTANLTTAAHDIENNVKKCDGYIADSEIGANGSTQRTGTWKVRVPVARFDDFVKSLQGIGDVVSNKITSQDVSEEFYDVEARLRNKKIEEAGLLQHLKASTARLSDILTVERELSRVREEIERIQGRLRFLSNQTDLTTITITVQERENGPKNGPSFVSQISGTFAGSLKAMADFFRGLTLAATALLPWLIVAGGIGLPFYLRRKRRRASSVPRPPAPLKPPTRQIYEE